jgi:hypothetical protein
MSKGDLGLDGGEYAPVAERIALFYARYPTGRIITRLVSRSEREVVFQALVYRAAHDARPAATGWAAEREGDGEVNTVACVENTETSAIGRALANLGFTASRRRPSREEMARAAQARDRRDARAAPGAPRPIGTRPRAVREAELRPFDARQSYANAVSDALALVAAAERTGLRARRAEWLRALLLRGPLPATSLDRLERRLRRWVLDAERLRLHEGAGRSHAPVSLVRTPS